KNYFVSMFLFNDGKIASMIDGSYCTLTYELLFYFFIGIFVWLFSTKRLEWFYASWLAISFFAFFFNFDQNIIAKLLCVRFAPYFVFGGVLALIVDRYRTSDFKTKTVYLTTLFASAIMPLYVSASLIAQKETITNFTGSFNWDEMMIVESFFIVIPLIVYMSLFSFAKTKKFANWCFILGGITYPLYLLHWTIGKTIISKYEEYTTISILSISVAVGLVVVSYFLSVYELPVRKLLKKKIEKYI
ncbi:MAG: hypothetical protein K9L31_01860, partial [Candidatus Pacebacteria bacterium]|nr:hypothetical protein [Candidatus Paceibacterota bacterium]